jgi:hypothetical protein
MRAIDFPPDIGAKSVYLQRNPVCLTELISDVCSPDKRGIRNHRNFQLELPKPLDLLAEMKVKRGLTIGDKSEIIDGLPSVVGLPDFVPSIPEDFVRFIERASFKPHVQGSAQLTVNAGIGADFRRDIVDP